MFITVEGPAFAGKTTLTKSLSEKVEDANVFERPCDMTSRSQALVNYVFAHSDYRPGQGENIILDGGHLWEATNLEQATKGGYGLLGVAGWRWTEMFLASRGAVTATLTADNSTLEARTLETEDEVDPVEILQYSSRYEFARRESMTVVAIHDGSLGETSAERYGDFVSSVLDDAKYWEEKAAETLSDFPEYIGSLTPTTLVVDYDENRTGLPMIPEEGSEYEFFFASLPDLYWRGVGVVNAAVLDEPEALLRLWTALGEPNVVALGAAEDYVARVGLPGDSIEHPADVDHDLSSSRLYGKLIRDIGLNQNPEPATIEEPHA